MKTEKSQKKEKKPMSGFEPIPTAKSPSCLPATVVSATPSASFPKACHDLGFFEARLRDPARLGDLGAARLGFARLGRPRARPGEGRRRQAGGASLPTFCGVCEPDSDRVHPAFSSVDVSGIQLSWRFRYSTQLAFPSPGASLPMFCVSPADTWKDAYTA